MDWNREKLESLPVRDYFRLRGLATTRLDTFIDAVFAFATTMLVISLGSIPETYPELIEALKGIPAFVGSFVQVMLIWLGHRRWSRRYGIEDAGTIFLSLLLIFIVLVYVYPLKLMFSALFNWISSGWLPSEFHVSTMGELTGLFIIYGIGTMVLAGTLSLLYYHSLKKSEQLELNAAEKISTRYEIVHWLTLAATGLASALYAWLVPEPYSVLAGFVYSTLAITLPVLGIRYDAKIKKAAVNTS